MLRIYDVIIDTVAGLRPVMERVGQHDAELARQMRRALASVALNVAEGSSSRGRNRGARYHTAAGSMREVGAAIDVAVALGYIDGVDELVRERLGLIVGTLMKNARS
ncbi:MAG: four helix bundle protein [Polyangiaceae bacterium]